MDEYDRLMLAAIVGAVLLVVSTWVVSSHFEARAYNRVTGANVSTVDAMFLSLRVQEAPE